MFNLKRNQIIITVLVFMIAIATYLNTQEGPISTEGNYVADAAITGDQREEVDFFEGYNDLSTPEVEQLAQGVEGDLTLQNAVNTETFSAVIAKKSVEEYENAEVEASKSLDTSYFAEEKLSREQSRAQQIEQLTQYVDNTNLDQDSKAKAATNLLKIQERIEKENSAEALLRAKGFEEVYVRIDDDTVDVVVNKADLTDSEIAQIEEIVNRKTGHSVSKINITPLNGVAKK